MLIILVAFWVAILWILVAVGVFTRWHRWMKLSPIILWVVLGVLVFVPMGWVSPAGPVIVLARSIQIAPGVSGRVMEVVAEAGKPLEQGDVLFKLDPTTYQAKVDQIATQLELAEDRLKQKTQLLQKGAGNQVDVEEAESEVDSLTASLEAASWNLEQSIVRAPIGGFVANVILPVGAQVNAGTPVMPFFSNQQRFVVAQIQQNHLRYIRVGQQAEVVFNVLPGRTFQAKVLRISRANPAGQVTPSGLAIGTETPRSDPFWVAVELDDKTVEPRPGMTGTAAIYTKPSGIRYFLRRVLLRMQSWASYVFVF